MVTIPLPVDILSNAAKILLLASFGITLVFSMRGAMPLSQSCERLAVAFFVILFYAPVLKGLHALGLELTEMLSKLTNHGSVLDLVKKNMQASLNGKDSNLMEFLRIGVWGVASSITDLLYLIAEFIIEVGRDALFHIVFILFPVAAGFYPIFPKILGSFALTAVELVLWLPMLQIVHIATGALSLAYTKIPHSVGFYTLSMEVVSIILTLSIPLLAHKLVTGAMSGTVMDSWAKTFTMASSFAQFSTGKIISPMVRSAKNFKSGIFLLLGMLFSQTIFAAHIHYGFVTKINCKGKLYLFSVGDDKILDVSPLPKESGCALLVKPKVATGRTNLFLETSAGSINEIISITNAPATKENLEINLESL